VEDIRNVKDYRNLLFKHSETGYIGDQEGSDRKVLIWVSGK
jgi:hypothetical protein